MLGNTNVESTAHELDQRINESKRANRMRVKEWLVSHTGYKG